MCHRPIVGESHVSRNSTHQLSSVYSTYSQGRTGNMATTGRGSITVLPPSPLDDDEQRPLLDAEHPDHGTIDRRIEGDEEDGDAEVIDEPTSTKVIVIMLCLWTGSFWAAMGMLPLLALPTSQVLTLVCRFHSRSHPRIPHKSELPLFNSAFLDRNRLSDRQRRHSASFRKNVRYLRQKSRNRLRQHLLRHWNSDLRSGYQCTHDDCWKSGSWYRRRLPKHDLDVHC